MMRIRPWLLTSEWPLVGHLAADPTVAVVQSGLSEPEALPGNEEQPRPRDRRRIVTQRVCTRGPHFLGRLEVDSVPDSNSVGDRVVVDGKQPSGRHEQRFRHPKLSPPQRARVGLARGHAPRTVRGAVLDERILESRDVRGYRCRPDPTAIAVDAYHSPGVEGRLGQDESVVEHQKAGQFLPAPSGACDGPVRLAIGPRLYQDPVLTDPDMARTANSQIAPPAGEGATPRDSTLGGYSIEGVTQAAGKA
jgi:hypothetical protein